MAATLSMLAQEPHLPGGAHSASGRCQARPPLWVRTQPRDVGRQRRPSCHFGT